MQELSADDSLYWRAAALQELADTLSVQLLLSKDGAEVSANVRLLARLICEPHGAGLEPAEQLILAKKRAQGALKVLNAPEPRKAEDAARLAAAAWVRVGVPSDMHWALALRPHELFEVQPYQVRLATDPGPFFEPRNGSLDLDPGQLDSVRRCGVWSPIHVRIVEEPAGLLVIAGSRRTRMIRVVIREGLEALKAGQVPVRPRPLLALVPAGEIDSDIYLADNVLRSDETPWTLAERFAMQLEASEGKLRAKDIAAKSGLSARLVGYYLQLAGLPAQLRAAGLAGRLGVKLGAFLAQIPDVEVQIKLFEVTLPLPNEAQRMEAARVILEREGADLADGREIVLPDLGKKAKGVAVFAPKLRANLAEAVNRSKGPARKQVALVADFVAACEGDAEAAERLPAELRETLLSAPTNTAKRRHPSQAREARDRRNAPPTWEGFTTHEQGQWIRSGLSQSNAEAFRGLGVPVDALFLRARLADDAPRVSIGKLFEDGSVDFPTAKRLIAEALNCPAALTCPVCGADPSFSCQDHECEVIAVDGWRVHPARAKEIEKLRQLLQAPAPAAASKQTKRWPRFKLEEQLAWEAAGIDNDVSAKIFLGHGIDAATVAQVVMVGEVRGTYGQHYTNRILSMAQIRARLRQIPLIQEADAANQGEASPLEVVCPVCAAEVGDACDDGGHPHKIRKDLAQKARGLRAVQEVL